MKLILPALLMACACASSGPSDNYWMRTGTGPFNFNADRLACSATTDHQAYVDCMGEHGWQVAHR